MEITFPQPTAYIVHQNNKGSAIGGSFVTASAIFTEMKALAPLSSLALAASNARAYKAEETAIAKEWREKAYGFVSRRNCVEVDGLCSQDDSISVINQQELLTSEFNSRDGDSDTGSRQG